ncbi:hypothetical protein FA95DRAFT_1016685 [Auriscalpium vulgare]|uniref:Uncharacterized protein n=1 Tax=Auriscalpium vulgare TaxID=40419 RepID=A0ACB8RWS6_9AGAM|nr:hypothetical protein FA95DRAFT_1016685 [Auriscalpium vulgare]
MLHTILVQLDYRSILACQTTCIRVKALVERTLELQYIIKLGASAMCEGPDARPLNFSERMRRLQAYEDARAGDTLELQELPFVPALVGSERRLRTSVNTLVLDTVEEDGLRVYVQQMPSAVRGIEESHWSLLISGDTRSVAAIDASQDVLVVRELRGNSDLDRGEHKVVVLMLALSTGEWHPSTISDPQTPMPWAPGYGDCRSVEVFGDRCAAICICLATGAICIVVWNWKTWTRILEIVPSESVPTFTARSQLTFLNDDYIAVTSGHPAILVYALNVNADHEAGRLPTAFLLPYIEFKPQVTLMPCSGVSGTDHAGLFHPAAATRMLSLHLTLLVPTGLSRIQRAEELLLMVPADTLLAHVSTGPVQATVEVRWSRWGPSGSRLAPFPTGTENPEGSRRIAIARVGRFFPGARCAGAVDGGARVR